MGSRERVAEFLRKSGVDFELKEFDGSTKSSALAAQALGCTTAEIAKSVVFAGGKTIVVVISGDKRVDPPRLAQYAAETLRIATPDEVRQRTGFPIGGVPPFPHAQGVTVLADASLLRFGQVWAAGGAPNAVFRIGTKDLFRLLKAGPLELSE